MPNYVPDISLKLRPEYSIQAPELQVLINNRELFAGKLTRTQCLVYQEPAATLTIKIQLFDNHDQPQNSLVHIDELAIMGVNSQKFVWAGVYRPCYPEPWATQQRENNRILEPELTNQDCLGWPGTWYLNINSAPWTWIHQQLHMGTIYD